MSSSYSQRVLFVFIGNYTRADFPYDRHDGSSGMPPCVLSPIMSGTSWGVASTTNFFFNLRMDLQQRTLAPPFPPPFCALLSCSLHARNKTALPPSRTAPHRPPLSCLSRLLLPQVVAAYDLMSMPVLSEKQWEAERSKAREEDAAVADDLQERARAWREEEKKVHGSDDNADEPQHELLSLVEDFSFLEVEDRESHLSDSVQNRRKRTTATTLRRPQLRE